MTLHESINDTFSLDNAVAFRVVRVARILRLHLARFLDRLGVELTPEQFFLLFRVCAQPSQSQTELADSVLADYANITRMVDSLAERGYVERSPDPDDRRRHLISPTRAGRRVLTRIQRALPAERRALFGGLGEDDFEAFIRVLDSIGNSAARRAQE